VFALETSGWKPDGKADEWRRLPDDPTLNVPAAALGFTQANARLVDDWLEAILSNRTALAAKRVFFSLANRWHPLAA